MSNTCPICGNTISKSLQVCDKCGFKFTGSTLSFKPLRSEVQPVEGGHYKQPNESFLRVLRGPFLDTIFPLTNKEIIIGRSPNCDICLNDMTVSRLHAKIIPEGSSFRIEDANSFNGVWVNNRSIDSHVLKQGDIVQLGTFCLIYQEV